MSANDIETFVRLKFLPIEATPEYVKQLPEELKERYTEVYNTIITDTGSGNASDEDDVVKFLRFMIDYGNFPPKKFEDIMVQNLVDFYTTEELIKEYSKV